MREPDDDGLVPPIKVLRKRLNGVYRADGFAGPTRRYVLIVAMLVGLASLPTLAAITAGSNELNDGRTGAMDVPFLPPPSGLPPAGPPADAPTPATGSEGQAGRPADKPRPSAAHREAGGRHSDAERYASEKSPQVSSSRRPSRAPSRGGSATPGGGSPKPGSGSEKPGGEPQEPGREERPPEPSGRSDEPTPPHKPVDPSHHHRPDRGRDERCDTHTVHHRSDDRSGSGRRPSMTEHPHNLRSGRWAERTHNSRRHHAESGPGDTTGAVRSYRGSHRAEDSWAHHRRSRVGHHHAEHRPRW